MFEARPSSAASARRCPHPPSRLRFGTEGDEATIHCQWCATTGPAARLLPGWAARWSAEAAAAALESLDAELAHLRPELRAPLRDVLDERARGLRGGELAGPT